MNECYALEDEMTTYRHLYTERIDGVSAQYEWVVDERTASHAARWATRRPEILGVDLAGMATYFPQWLLTGSLGGRPAGCQYCGVPLVPTDEAMRCVKCRREGKADSLMWLGHIPALARPGPQFVGRQAALRRAGFGEVAVGTVTYLLVPLTVGYPDQWPNVEPVVRYVAGWLDVLGLPRGSATHHLIQGGRACLFGWGQWSRMPIHAVLQQRVVNHIHSLLKIAAGQQPGEAFIGRIHNQSWRPIG